MRGLRLWGQGNLCLLGFLQLPPISLFTFILNFILLFYLFVVICCFTLTSRWANLSRIAPWSLKMFTFFCNKSFLSIPGPRGKAPSNKTTWVSLKASTTSDVIITPVYYVIIHNNQQNKEFYICCRKKIPCTKEKAQSSISNNTPCNPGIAAGIF